MIRFNCTHCGLRIEVDDRFAGKAGSCQQCGKPVKVPELEPNIATGLDSLRDAPDIAPVSIGAYGKAADAGWVDPAAKATAEEQAVAAKKAAEPAVPLPDIPAEILAAAKERKKQNMKYIMGAALLALVIIVLLLPLLVPEKKPPAVPAPVTPAPQFGEQ
jgi:hypothetical protein